MNTQEFRATIDQLHERLIALTETKGEEYKRREDNQFANFERGAQSLGLTREQVLMVYLSKHLDSITTWVRDCSRGEDRQYAEPITGRIDDAILYLLLLRGMAQDRLGGIDLRSHTHRMPPPATGHWLDKDDVPKPGTLADMVARCQKPESDPSTTSNAHPKPPRPMPSTPPRGLVFLAKNHAWAVAACRRHDVPAATCALSTTDQLRGLPRNTEVVYIHNGYLDGDHLFEEVKVACTKHSLSWSTGFHVE